MTPKPQPVRTTANLKAFVADDDDDACALVANALRRAGFEVHQAHNGHELLACFKEHATARALVVSDIGMPECDGIEATIAVKKLAPQAVIVLVTAFVDQATAVVARDAGAAVVLHKPLDLRALLRTVHALLTRP
ncbi:MAG: response regulator [Myxococcales bacterium]|nr:response regulator [Myxococcales bacterium]